MFQQPT